VLEGSVKVWQLYQLAIVYVRHSVVKGLNQGGFFLQLKRRMIDKYTEGLEMVKDNIAMVEVEE
jgi:hypothetical protein